MTAPPILPSLNNYESVFREHGVDIVTPDFAFKELLTEDELHRSLVDIDGILCGDDQLSKSVIERAKRLKVISKWGTGIDSIDVVAANALGIKVCRVEDAFAAPVADTVLAYILLFSRRIVEKDQIIRAGDWRKVKSFSLNEQSLGVIGVGHIGQAVIRRAAAFGMKLYGCDIRPAPESFLRQTGVEMVKLAELVSKSDYISLNCDLNPTTFHIISEMTLRLMRSNTCVINTARGSLIDETALVCALKEGLIAGAALDVFEKEPLAFDHPLRSLENVWLSPHNSNGSPAVFKRVDKISIHNLLVGLGVCQTELGAFPI